MRNLKFFFWGGALAISIYGLARICFVGRNMEQEADRGKERMAAVVGNRVEIPGAAFADKAEAVRQLKLDKRHNEAINLLLKLLEAAEEEAVRSGSAVAAWYYEQLAILYRKEERFAEEVELLKRYLTANEKHGGTSASKLKNRLARAMELLSGSTLFPNLSDDRRE